MTKFTLFIIVTLALFSSIEARRFTFQNRCPYTVWVGSLNSGPFAIPNNGGWALRSGQSNAVNVVDNWGGRFWGRTGCRFDGSGHGSCETGDCGRGLACSGAGGATPATLAEFKLRGDQGKDFYDVSLVDGYNLPIKIQPDRNCGVPTCTRDLNKNCPRELQKVIGGRVVACLSACEKFKTDAFCCRGRNATPQTCPPTNYSRIFKSSCPTAYSYAYDDPSSTFTCRDANYSIIFCP